jgi:hypothetical protein
VAAAGGLWPSDGVFSYLGRRPREELLPREKLGENALTFSPSTKHKSDGYLPVYRVLGNKTDNQTALEMRFQGNARIDTPFGGAC